MKRMGMKVDKHHHEVAGSGQHELGMKFGTLIDTADNVQLYKYAVQIHSKNTYISTSKHSFISFINK